MLKKDEYYSKAEGEILKNSQESINYVKNQMKDVLEMKMKNESVVNDSVAGLNAMPMNDYSEMQSSANSLNNTSVQTKSNVRVRKLEGPIKSAISPSVPNIEQSQSNNYYGNNYSNNANINYSKNPMNRQGPMNTGVSTTYILLATVVLIALVFLVSTAMILYFGIN